MNRQTLKVRSALGTDRFNLYARASVEIIPQPSMWQRIKAWWKRA